MSKETSRRQFLKAGATAGLAAALNRGKCKTRKPYFAIDKNI
jgi:uncharacterized protein (DUF1501 family)